MRDHLFNPQHFIGREQEQTLFREMLQFKEPARVLAIRDSGGKGKSQLLKQLHHRCTSGDLPAAASLIALDQLPDETPLSLIQVAVADLMDAGVEFAQYTYFEKARVRGDFAAIQSSSYLQGSDAQVSTNTESRGAPAFPESDQRTNVVELSPEQELAAQEVSLKAFFDDLRLYTQSQPVVLLFDAYERGGEDLRRWIETELLAAQLPQQPHLLVVLAGRSLPDYAGWEAAEVETYTRHIDELTRWGLPDVAAYLDAHQYQYNDAHLQLMGRMADHGLPPSLIVQTASAVLRRDS